MRTGLCRAKKRTETSLRLQLCSNTKYGRGVRWVSDVSRRRAGCKCALHLFQVG